MKIYLFLVGALALIAAGIFMMEYGRPPPVPCSQRLWENQQDLDWCIAQEAEVARLQAALEALREKNARETACDHRSWFGLVGKNECSP